MNILVLLLIPALIYFPMRRAIEEGVYYGLKRYDKYKGEKESLKEDL